jgi:hypothetical protein
VGLALCICGSTLGKGTGTLGKGTLGTHPSFRVPTMRGLIRSSDATCTMTCDCWPVAWCGWWVVGCIRDTNPDFFGTTYTCLELEVVLGYVASHDIMCFKVKGLQR